MKKILVVGSLNIDCVIHVDHTPVTGETIICSDMSMIPGGKGANQACAAGKLGADVKIFGAVGNDSYAAVQKKSLAGAGVDISHLIEKTNCNTGFALISIDKKGDNSIVVIPGANTAPSREDIDDNIELIEQSDIVLFQLEIPVDTVLYAAEKAKMMGKTVILDPAPVPEKFPEELYRFVDIIKPNETELEMLTGAGNRIEEGASRLRKSGVRDVVVTLGENGIYLDSAEMGQLYIPAVKVSAVDTTAAGDTFTAAMAVMLSRGENLKEAVNFANIASSIAVTREGAQTSIPSLEEVQKYLSGQGDSAAIRERFIRSGICI